jgi:UDP-N-acetylmuramoyl-L-alanyl-D-glutamate--2,6-diaminopimelate ligase
MELVSNKKNLNIIVDFALTPHALTQLYIFVDGIKKQGAKVIGVFGACGERDRGKRPITGEIVSAHTDYVILTDDEPYHEDPKRIIEEISAGINNKLEGENFWKIPDRREAIKKALLLAKPGDFVVVTGMGAENTRGVGNQKIPWNDKKVILEELSKL